MAVAVAAIRREDMSCRHAVIPDSPRLWLLFHPMDACGAQEFLNRASAGVGGGVHESLYTELYSARLARTSSRTMQAGSLPARGCWAGVV